MEPKRIPKGPKIHRHFHIWWVLDAFFGFSMRTRHLPSLFYRFWHAFHQVFLKALRKKLARTSREPAKNLASTYDYCRTPSFKTGAAVLRPWAAFNRIIKRLGATIGTSFGTSNLSAVVFCFFDTFASPTSSVYMLAHLH